MTDESVSRPPVRKVQGASARPGFSQLKLQIEAILFAAESALEVPEIRAILGEVSLSDVRLALKDLSKDYEERSFYVHESGGKFQLRTREEFADLLRRQYQSKPRTLSKSALETLAIVAYKQPVTRAEVNAIRNVDSSSIMATLKERELIVVSGTRREVGNPMEYRTSEKFLEVFGLSSLKELPSLRSLQMSQRDQEQVVSALKSLKVEETEPDTAADLAFSDN